MSHNDSEPPASAESSATVDQDRLAESFDRAWQDGEQPEIEESLKSIPAAGRQALVAALAQIDFDNRLARGEAVRVEEYLQRFPDLNANREAVLALIYSEFEARRRQEPELEVEDYIQRFPWCGAPLAKALSRPRPGCVAVRLNCPHCQNPIEVVDDRQDHDDVLCPSCGSSFQLAANRTASWKPGKLPRLGKFELLEEVGRGAFGTVYRAHDDELDRIVAIKLPRSGSLATPEDEDRFIREARSVASLRHPSIVSVYETGRSEHFPYIVSEFVQGVTLSDSLTGRRLSPRESAQLLATLAETLQYAHEHGVIHRDIKPSNIMLDELGRPHVMDFGLARRDAGEITMTTEGQILGTPAYMSPEQAKGEAHQVDGRSDLYSLGVVLFELLTGDLPFRGNIRMLLNQVIHEEPRNPRSLNDRVPRDLETICLKAMAKDPGRRYATGGDLAADLQRWLRGEPILARPIGRVERTLRWVRRNPTVATLTTAVAAALLLGTVFSTFFGIQANSRANEAIRERQEAERARQTAESERRRAEENLAEASRQRERAEQGFRDARAAVDRYYTAVSENQMLNVPGLQPVRKDLLEAALEFYKKVAAERPDDPDVRRALAGAHYRVGQTAAINGAIELATTSYNTALAIQEQLVRDVPAVTAHRSALAETIHALGQLQSDVGRLAEAEALYGKAIGIQETLAAAEPANTDFQSRLANGYSSLGYRQSATGRRSDADVTHNKALAIREQLVREQPANAKFRASLATSYETLANLRNEMGKKPEADAFYQKAIELLDGLIRENPQAVNYQSSLADLYSNVGYYQANLGELSEAESSYGKTLEIREKLARDNPSVPEYHSDLADSYHRITSVRSDFGRQAEAESAYQKAITITRQLMSESPAAIEYQSALARFLIALGVLHRDAGRNKEAEVSFREALDLYGQLIRNNPAILVYRVSLARSHNHMAQLQSATGRNSESEASHRQALEIREALVRDDPGDSDVQSDLAISYFNVAECETRKRRLPEAEALHLKALRIREELAQANPGSADFQSELGTSYRWLANLQRDAGRTAEADASYHRALEIQERLARDNPAVTHYQLMLAGSYDNLAALKRAQGRGAEADALEDQAIKARQRLARSQDQDTAELADGHYRRGLVEWGRHHLPGAEEAYKKAIVIADKLVREQPTATDFQAILSSSQLGLGLVYQAQGKFSDAEGCLNKALPIQESLEREYPGTVSHRAAVAQICSAFGQLYMSQGRNAEAEKSLSRARDAYAKLAADHPDKMDFQARQSQALCDLGRVLIRSDRYPESAECFRGAIAIEEQLVKDNPSLPRKNFRSRVTYDLALCQLAQGENEDAQASFRKVIDIGYQFWPAYAHAQLIEQLRRRDADQEAVELLKKRVEALRTHLTTEGGQGDLGAFVCASLDLADYLRRQKNSAADEAAKVPQDAKAVYRKVLGDRTDLNADELSLAALLEVVPLSQIELVAGQPVDLLALVDPQRDAVKGKWRFDNRTLVTSNGDNDRLEIPLVPPTDYVLEMTVQRVDNLNTLTLGLVIDGVQFAMVFDVGGNKSGLEAVDGAPVTDEGNETNFRGTVISPGKPKTIRCEIHKSSVLVTCDGREIVRWKGRTDRLSTPPWWRVRNLNTLSLGVQRGSEFRIDKMTLKSLVPPAPQ